MLASNGDLRHAVSYVHSDSRLSRKASNVCHFKYAVVVESKFDKLQVVQDLRATSPEQSCARKHWCANVQKQQRLQCSVVMSGTSILAVLCQVTQD